MLKTEKNNKSLEAKIKKAAKDAFKTYRIEGKKIFTVFEHGHWWIKFYDLAEEQERTFSVMDAEGLQYPYGFCFEEC